MEPVDGKHPSERPTHSGSILISNSLNFYKMNNQLSIFITSILVLALFSCKKTLDVEPTNQVNASTSVRTPADAQIMINGIVRSMSSSDYYGRNFILYGDAKGGDMTIPSSGRGNDGLYTFNHAA